MEKVVLEICSLMEQKKHMFELYEIATDSILDCETENIENYIIKRTELAIDIDRVSYNINNIVQSSTNSCDIVNAIFNKCSRGDLPQVITPIFDKAQEIFSIINRISNKNKALLVYMENTKQSFREKIKENNFAPKINSYLNSFSYAPNSINFGKV